MVASGTPTLAKIKNEASMTDIRALLYIAVCEVCDFYNVGKNMNSAQVAMTADLIYDRFWYFKLEEIKYCFRRAMLHAKLFDRIDGNIILGWLTEYDAERTEEAMRLSDEEAARQQNNSEISPETISFEEYVDELKKRSTTDKDAAERLEQIEAMTSQPTIIQTEQKERDFQIFKLNYLFGNKK